MLAVLRDMNFIFSFMRNNVAVKFAVFAYVTVMSVKRPQRNFLDEIIK